MARTGVLRFYLWQLMGTKKELQLDALFLQARDKLRAILFLFCLTVNRWN